MHTYVFKILFPTFELLKTSALLHVSQSDALERLEGMSIKQSTHNETDKNRHKRNSKHNDKQVT